MSSLFVPDSVARDESGISDADLSAQFAAHAEEAKRRERKGQWHLLFILVFVLGPLVVYPLARLVMLSVTGRTASRCMRTPRSSATRKRAA